MVGLRVRPGLLTLRHAHHPRLAAWPSPSPRTSRPNARWEPPGDAWLDRLPRLAGDLLDAWHLTPTGASLHGYCSLVVPVTDADGGGGRPQGHLRR